MHRAFLKARRRQITFSHGGLEEVSAQVPACSPERADHVDSAQVLSALAQVDELRQAAVALFYLEDYAYKEIAEILAVPIGTVRSRIACGIIQLRRILGCAEPEPAPVPPSSRTNAEAARCDGHSITAYYLAGRP